MNKQQKLAEAQRILEKAYSEIQKNIQSFDIFYIALSHAYISAAHVMQKTNPDLKLIIDIGINKIGKLLDQPK